MRLPLGRDVVRNGLQPGDPSPFIIPGHVRESVEGLDGELPSPPQQRQAAQGLSGAPPASPVVRGGKASLMLTYNVIRTVN